MVTSRRRDVRVPAVGLKDGVVKRLLGESPRKNVNSNGLTL